MKTSPINLLISPTIGAASAVAPVAGKIADNLLIDDTLRVYAVAGNMDISIYNIGGVRVDVVALFNVSFDSALQVRLYDSGDVLVYTENFVVADLTGWKYKNLYFEVPVAYTDVNRIRVTTTGGSIVLEKYLGFVWAGSLIDFGEVEKAQPLSDDNNSVQISRTNYPDIMPSYKFRGYKVTTRKENDYLDLRGWIEEILDNGFGYGRPWIFDEYPWNGEVIFGNLDSGKIPIDMFRSKKFSGATTSDFLAQCSMGIREVT